MKVVVGNIWNQEHVVDVLLVTTNCIVNARGELVMGRGAAQEAANRYPGVALELGQIITEKGYTARNPYGVIILPSYANGVQLGAFQVKHHWQYSAAIDLIKLSAYKLKVIAEACPKMTFAVNYPGIGNGRLTIAQVEPTILGLPDNVTFYKKE